MLHSGKCQTVNNFTPELVSRFRDETQLVTPVSHVSASLVVPATLLAVQMQLPAQVPQKAAWAPAIPATPARDLNGVPSSWLRPGPDPAVVAVCGVNQ